MAEQVMAQERPSLVIMTRWDGEQVPQKEVKTPEKHKGRKLPKVLSPAMVNKLFRNINTDCRTGLRNRAALETMLCAGLRISELCDLKPGCVDFTENMIHVINGKGGTDRNIPIRPSLKEWLLMWDEIRPQQAEFFFCAVNKCTQLLPRYFNQVLERLSIKGDVYLQDDELNPIPVSCHKLRHTCATNWLRDGFSLPDIQRLLGHKNINTTMVYLEVNMDDLKAKMSALG